MSAELLGHPFDIHTGGIDHREIHHPNEIAQNQAMQQAHGCGPDTGARIWMHNNFLIDRRGKMSKSSGDFLTLQALVDRGFHPLAFRMLCLQAHYRSELEFSWEGLAAALVRLKRLVMGAESLRPGLNKRADIRLLEVEFDAAVSDDLNTPQALTFFERAVMERSFDNESIDAVKRMGILLGLRIYDILREDLRIRPSTAIITEPEIEAALAIRKEARAAKDFGTSDRIRDELAAKDVEVMDGDPLGWDWKLNA